MSVCPIADRNPGEYPLEVLPDGWANAKVFFSHRDGRVEKRIEILRLSDGSRYSQEPLAMIAAKCFGLFAALLPCYMAVYTLFHLIRLPVATLLNLSPSTFCKQIWKIVRIPFYFIALECAALYGVFNPLEGRALFGKFESVLHDGKTRREAEQYKKESEKGAYWSAIASIDNKSSFFAGFCMQPIGSTTDPHIISYEVLPNLEQITLQSV
jgi:hypothetical protein